MDRKASTTDKLDLLVDAVAERVFQKTADRLPDLVAASLAQTVAEAIADVTASAQPQPDRLLDMAQVAERLNVSKQTLVWWRKKHKWPETMRLVNIGSGDSPNALRLRVRESDVDAFIAARTTEATDA